VDDGVEQFTTELETSAGQSHESEDIAQPEQDEYWTTLSKSHLDEVKN